MPNAIITKYLDPSNCKASRIVARVYMGGGSYRQVVQSTNNVFSVQENHIQGARKLAVKQGWSGVWFGTDLDAKGTVWVHAVNARRNGDVFTVMDNGEQAAS